MKNDLRSLPTHQYWRITLCAIFGSIYTFQIAHAKGNLEFVQTPTGAAAVFKPSSPNTSDTKLNFTSSGQPYLSSSKAYTIPGAKAPITLALKQPIAKQTAAKALTKALVKASPIGSAISIGSILYDYFQDQDFNQPRMETDINGNTILQYKSYDPNLDDLFSSSYINNSNAEIITSCQPCTLQLFGGEDIIKSSFGQSHTGIRASKTYSDSAIICTLYSDSSFFKSVHKNNSCPPSSTINTRQLTMNQLEDHILSDSGWPSSTITFNGVTKTPPTINSPIGQALNKVITSSDIELEPQPQPAQITGPSKVDGQTTTTTSTAPDGRTITTTNTTTYNITYQGDTFNIKEEKKTVTNDGETVKTETAEQEKILEEPEPDLCQKYPNITACQEPKEQKDFCETNPDSIACQKFELDTPTGDIPKQNKTIEYQAADLGFGGGSCPSPLTQTLASGKTITLFDWPKACDYVVTYVKPIFISLATFAALMIIFVGGNRENSI